MKRTALVVGVNYLGLILLAAVVTAAAACVYEWRPRLFDLRNAIGRFA